MITISKLNFEQEVKKSSIPVLIDFWAPWCAPCRAVSPILEDLAVKYSGRIKIGKINVDDEPAISAQYRVMSIPTLLFFKSGILVKQMIGLRSRNELEDMINKLSG